MSKEVKLIVDGYKGFDIVVSENSAQLVAYTGTEASSGSISVSEVDLEKLRLFALELVEATSYDG